VLHNQILKTTLHTLLQFKELDSSIRDTVLGMDRRLREVELLSLTKRHFKVVQLHSNNGFYGFLLNICELIHDNLFISEEDGTGIFRDFVRDEKHMAMVFEAFVRNFYKREQTSFLVGRENITWDFVPLEGTSSKYLPKMQTDISLSSATRKIIIDTKYYTEALHTYYDKESIRSEHLRQIHAYMTNLPIHEKESLTREGILLYPTVQDELDERYDSPGHGYQLRIITLNLNQPWKRIHRDLLKIIVAE
jgi:5-methylcytosine-specific restriction enzyme subunit McrC